MSGAGMTGIERIPPHNLQAEQAVLGAMLVDRDAIALVVEALRGPSFYRPVHQVLFDAMVRLFERGEPVDTLTVRDALGKEKLEEVGGYGYLVDLADAVPTTAHAAFYAQIVEEKALLRNLIHATSEAMGLAYAGEMPVEDILDRAEALIMEVGSKRSSNAAVAIKEIIFETVRTIEKRYAEQDSLVGTTSGYYDLDQMTSGFQPSDLIILAARPAMGKTSLALNIGRNVAVEAEKPVLIFSLEMSGGQLVQRMLCSEAGIDAHRLKNGYLAQSDWSKLTEAIGVLSEAPIYIDDAANLTVMEVRSKARRVIAEHGNLGIILIDYLQLMSGKGNENRVQELSLITRQLKNLARELDVTIIALSQLSRNVESRTDKRPMLSDLRESGSIEQDSDIVMFIYRDEYYNPDSDKKNTAEVIIAKHRNGPVGTVHLYFEKSMTKFQSIAGPGLPA